MADTREGFMLPKHEEKLDRLIKFKNPIAESLDGPAIRLADNQGLQRLKPQIIKQLGEGALPLFYQVIDTIMEEIPEPEED